MIDPKKLTVADKGRMVTVFNRTRNRRATGLIQSWSDDFIRVWFNQYEPLGKLVLPEDVFFDSDTKKMEV